MTSRDIRERYIKFFVGRGHKQIAPAKLIPENDPTTLFTSSGMQPLVPYLLGQEHSEGKRLVNSQPCFRAEDIEEVGDGRHTTFFEMLGNWSLGDYFKKEQLPWIWAFFTKDLELPKEKLYVSVFEGNKEVPKDTASLEIWKSLGVSDDHIYLYGVDKNWWSYGEVGGPDSEVFYEFTQSQHDNCHPNCDCGRFLEIGNSVFIEYQKQSDGPPAGGLKELPQKNVDFGGGLERLTAASLDNPDVFQTDLYQPIIHSLEKQTNKKYQDNKAAFQIITDHMRAATFLIKDGIRPSNKLQGYILRRLLRRSAVKMHQLGGNLSDLAKLTDSDQDVISEEIKRFQKTLDHGLKEVEKIEKINGKKAFDLYQTFGFPFEVTEELFRQKGQAIDREQFKQEFEKHKQLSRTASAGMFKGGLADHSDVVIKYHTATHLLHQALRDVLGPQVFQKGSNITSERLRFDFSYDNKMTDEQIKQVEAIVNKRIKEDLKVDHLIVSLAQAKKMNAIGLFDEKYADKVSIYGIGPGFKNGGYYSLEFCGGPHVEHTNLIGKINRGTILLRKIKITKEEAISSGIRRIRAHLVLR